MVDVPEVGDGFLSEGGAVEVAVGAELGGEGGAGEAARALGLPKAAPPAFVRGEGVGVFGGAGLGDLRAVRVADAGLEMVGVGAGELEQGGFFIEDEALGDNAPVAEVGGDFELGQGAEDATEEPGIVGVTAAMGLAGDGDAVGLFEVEHAGEKGEGVFV